MKSIIKDSLILFAITIIAGFLLGLVYDITKEPIENQKAVAKAKACQAVFEDATEFSEIDISAYEDKLNISGVDISEIYSAQNEDNSLGYVITATSHNGYGGDIVLLVGIRNDGTVNGISFISINETAGLGMKAKEDDFKNQFNNKKVEVFEYTKTGAVKDNEIDAISAATVTTSAVTEAVNGALTFFNENLLVPGGVQ